MFLIQNCSIIRLLVKFSIFLVIFVVYTSCFAQKIAVTQIVSHPALNKVRDGVRDELVKNFGKDVSIEFSDAGGNITTAIQIAHKIISKNPDLVIAITTPSAQTMVKAAKDSNIPILFSTVTDPIESKIYPHHNVSGVRNQSPVLEQIEFMLKILPHAKTVGMIVNNSDIGSHILFKKSEELLKQKNIRLVVKSVVSSNDVKSATDSLVNNVDVIFLQQDNTVASALKILLKTAAEHKIPVFSGYSEATEAGALAGLAYDEYQIGVQTAKLATKILKGSDINKIAFEDPTTKEFSINYKTAKALNIKFSQDVINLANKIYEERDRNY